MATRAKDWLGQGYRDLEHAKHSLQFRDFEWVCFASQQAAEKAVKALIMSQGGEGWGHSITRLLEELPSEIRPNSDLFEAAKILDKMYIPPRYPNGFDIGKPGDYYTEKEAKEAIQYAEAIYNFCKDKIYCKREGH
jgi:HEPN domain-containing protein